MRLSVKCKQINKTFMKHDVNFEWKPGVDGLII